MPGNGTEAGGDGPTALVTGGARGIGRAIAAGLAARGHAVVLTARRADAAEAAAAELAAARGPDGPPIEGMGLEITDHARCAEIVDTILLRFGRLDALVNNAGVWLEASHLPDAAPGSILEEPAPIIRQSLEANALGPLALTRAAASAMRRAGHGRIVNVSSGSGQLSDMQGGDTGYRLSKTALNAITRIFAAELYDDGILVNALCPGWVSSRLGGPEAPRTPDQGADTAIWLATLPSGGPTGGFFRDRSPIPW